MTDRYELLRKEFPADKIQGKPKGGKMLKYISHGLITERLNQADPDWSTYSVSEHIYFDDEKRPHCAGVTIALTLLGTTRIEAGGPQNITGKGNFPYNFADEIKNAYSDALKRAAMRFGVALSMWEDLIDAEGDEDVNPGGPSNYDAPYIPPKPRLVPAQATPTHVQAAQKIFDAEPVPKGNQQAGSFSGPMVGPTERQGKMIFAISNQLGMSEEQLHQMAGVDSLKNLTREGVSFLIDQLKALQGGEERVESIPQPPPSEDNEVVSWTDFYKIGRSLRPAIANRADFEREVGIPMPATVEQAMFALENYAKNGTPI